MLSCGNRTLLSRRAEAQKKANRPKCGHKLPTVPIPLPLSPPHPTFKPTDSPAAQLVPIPRQSRRGAGCVQGTATQMPRGGGTKSCHIQLFGGFCNSPQPPHHCLPGSFFLCVPTALGTTQHQSARPPSLRAGSSGTRLSLCSDFS